MIQFSFLRFFLCSACFNENIAVFFILSLVEIFHLTKQSMQGWTSDPQKEVCSLSLIKFCTTIQINCSHITLSEL